MNNAILKYGFQFVLGNSIYWPGTFRYHFKTVLHFLTFSVFKTDNNEYVVTAQEMFIFPYIALVLFYLANDLF